MNKLEKVISFSFLIFLGCAKERPVQDDKTLHRDQYNKEQLVGTSGSTKAYLYSSTVVNVSENGGFAFVGLQGPTKMGYFKFTKENLSFYSAESLYDKESVNTSRSLINQWSITHHDTKLDDSSGKIANVEVEDDDKEWNEKRNFKVDLAGHTLSDLISEDGCFDAKSTNVVDDSVEITEDYFSFVTAVQYEATGACDISMSRQVHSDIAYTVSYRHSFKLLENSKYKPFVYKSGDSDPLRSKYGYFTTTKEQLDSKTNMSKITLFMNRWDTNKEHHYFFSKEFPEKYKWIFTDPKIGVFARTNKLLEQTGNKIRFRIHENNGVDGKVKEIGDIRYSFINLIEEINPVAPLGYGPMRTDPRTGEIVSANVNLWTGYLKYYMKRISDGLENGKKIESSTLNARMEAFLGVNANELVVPMNLSETKAGGVFQDLMQNSIYSHPYFNEFTRVDVNSLTNGYFVKRDHKKIAELMREDEQTLFEQEALKMDSAVNKVIGDMAAHKHDQTGGCRYPVEHHVADIRQGLIDGVDEETILSNILYRTAIHEFGHNLNLRHNFFGSVDKKNFHTDRVIRDAAGKDKTIKAKSSSVMDYLSLEDEMHSDLGWESYDEAAILYAYSDGKVDTKKKFLFCTDEHKFLNAMCNTWDHGATPTEVIKSMIEDYDKLYYVLNYRYNRAYWDTTGYASRIFETMFNIKKFLPMWRTDFTPDKITSKLRNNSSLSKDEKEEVANEINDQFLDAIKLSVAFFDSVIQQSSADRPWQTEYEEKYGAVERIGILSDKIFATRFLIGDEGILYNPSRPMNYASYLTYTSDVVSHVANQSKIAGLINKAFEDTITIRVDMDIWFASYARSLYAMNAFNGNNEGDNSLIDRMKVLRFSGPEFIDNFGVNASKLKTVETDFVIGSSVHPEISVGSVVGLVKHDGYVYLVDKSKSEYAYNLIEQIKSGYGEGSINSAKNDLVWMYGLYLGVKEE